MMPDASQWRSAARYEPVEHMSARLASPGEWLRRNEAYDRDFRALLALNADLDHADGKHPPALEVAISR